MRGGRASISKPALTTRGDSCVRLRSLQQTQDRFVRRLSGNWQSYRDGGMPKITSRNTIMNFLLTNYIYPMRERLLLSGNLEIYLDNPRTDEEIEAVREYIVQAYSSVESIFQFSEEIFEQTMKDLLNKYSQADEYIGEFYNNNSHLNQYEILARMWIVARYNDEGLHKEITEANRKLREEGKSYSFLIEGDDSPIIISSRQLADYIPYTVTNCAF
jgi:hypothetical protein